MALNVQSQNIASHTPVTPIAKYFPNTKLRPTRKTHIESTDKTIGNFTSLAAMKMFWVVKARGQIVHKKMVWKKKIWRASELDSGDKL